jgi:5'-3' exonuclease
MTTPAAAGGGGRLLAVDAATLYFRAFFAIPATVRAPDGRPVNAVRGYLDMTATLVQRFRPTGYAACWDDDWRPAFRVAAVPSYKTHRLAGDGTEEVPDELRPQVPVLAQGLSLLGLAGVGAPGHEADDAAATVAAGWARSGRGPVVVASGDKDLFQLVDDAAGVSVAYVGRGVARLEVVDGAALGRRFGVSSGTGYRDLAVLVGDRSDGLPGVPGIGPGSAADLLRRYGDLDGLLAAAADPDSDMSPAWRRRIEASRDYVTAARLVVTGVRDAVLRLDVRAATPEDSSRSTDGVLDALAPIGRVADPDALAAWADRWGVRTSVNRVLAALEATRAGDVDAGVAPGPAGA